MQPYSAAVCSIPATRGEEQSAVPTAGVLVRLAVTTLNTPGGMPAWWTVYGRDADTLLYLVSQLCQGEGGQGGVLARLHHAGAARRQRRPRLPRDHRVGEVPWSNHRSHA